MNNGINIELAGSNGSGMLDKMSSVLPSNDMAEVMLENILAKLKEKDFLRFDGEVSDMFLVVSTENGIGFIQQELKEVPTPLLIGNIEYLKYLVMQNKEGVI